jgi:hypothetical protein
MGYDFHYSICIFEFISDTFGFKNNFLAKSLRMHFKLCDFARKQNKQL